MEICRIVPALRPKLHLEGGAIRLILAAIALPLPRHAAASSFAKRTGGCGERLLNEPADMLEKFHRLRVGIQDLRHVAR
jgi:hypothetical protein